MAGRYELKLDESSDCSLIFTWTAGGLPVDLTGYLFRVVISNDKGVEVCALSSVATPNGSSVCVCGNPTEGKFRVYLAEADTRWTAWRNGFWICESKAPGAPGWIRQLHGRVVLFPRSKA